MTWVVLLTGAVVMMLPLTWMVSSSFKLEQRVFQFPPQLIPDPFCPQNYAEALAYMYPRVMEAPMDRDWTDIYLYLGTKVMAGAGTEMPEDIRVESLNDGQMRDLNRLKAWIYQQRIKVRLERDRAERRQKKEEAAAAREAAQPALFDF